MDQFTVIAFTHRSIGLEQIGRLHIEEDQQQGRLEPVKAQEGLQELMYLTTCNRVEYLLRGDTEIDQTFLKRFFARLYPDWEAEQVEWAASETNPLTGLDAVRHLFHVAGSLDSLVVGEREIITQVRRAYEQCHKWGLTGDFIRLALRKTIETAKQIYTETAIADRPVSVVNLAYKKMMDAGSEPNSRVLMIGAGTTMQAMSGNLLKHSFGKLTVYNRTLSKAAILAGRFKDVGAAKELKDIQDHQGGFDVLITCTGAADKIVTKELYKQLLNGETTRKTVIDLAIPSDFDRSIATEYDVNLIAVEDLKEIARENLREREKELFRCEQIVEEGLREFETMHKERQIEVAMKAVPAQVKEIRKTAVEEVFAKDLANLDEASKEVMEKVLNYVEKKYISMPMKMAKEILLQEQKRKL